MKKFFIITAFLFALLLVTQFASAALVISNLDDKTAVHNSILPLQFTVANTGANVSDIALTITNISDSSQALPVTILNNSKKSIIAGGNETYTIDYAIPQYTAPGAYSVIIAVFGNESDTAVSKSKTFDIQVNETLSLDLSEMALILIPDTNISTSLSVKNTGNVALSNITFTQLTQMNDSDNNNISFHIPAIVSLAVGEIKILNFNINVPRDQEVKEYSSVIRLTATGASQSIIQNIALSVTVETNFCDEGNIGSEVTLKEIRSPDAGDDFYPSDKVDVDLRVRNHDDRDKDITVIADLFDVTDGEFVDIQEEQTVEVADGDIETVTLTLTLPSDLDEDHVYRIYAKAYEDGAEDEQCQSDYVPIDIQKNTHDVAISKITIPDEVSCNSVFDLKLRVSNTGEKDEDVQIKIYNKELGISEEKTLELDSDDDKDVIFSIKTPKTANEKNYTLRIDTFFDLSGGDYDESKTDSAILELSGDCSPASSFSLSANIVEQAIAGNKFSIKVTLYNTGQDSAKYKITVSGYNDWATLDRIEPVEVSIEPDETGTAYIYLNAFSNKVGTQSLTVKALSNGKTTTETVSILIKEQVTAKGLYARAVDKLQSFSGLDITTINIILIIAIILLVVWVFRLRR